MSFFTPRYLTQARELRAAAKKLFNYHCDLWSLDQQAEATASLDQFDEALQTKNPQIVAIAQAHVETLFSQLVPKRLHCGLTENIESIIIAIALAVSFQAYFLKPFKIPTGSMQPTLFGMTGHPQTTPSPNILMRSLDFIQLGRSYLQVKAAHDETIISLEERTILNFFTFTKVTTSEGKYSLFAPRDVVIRDFEIVPGRVYHTGETMAQGYVQAGDQVFVDRISYAFRQPKSADVFVILTTGIPRIEMTLNPELGSQYYIKRLAGLPGDTLRIAPPLLFINESIPSQPSFKKVMSATNGYRGYSNGSENGQASPYLGSPDDSFTVPSNGYFALGDNSYNSSDSRYWGIVPEHNVIGRGFFVYWPFSTRWGFIH